MKLIDAVWYGNHPLSYVLAPLSWLFCAIAGVRRYAYHWRLLPSQRCTIPVIVVGNITVGGTGKTPLVIWLGQFLKQHGYRPGIVSRGYGGKSSHYPLQVLPDSLPGVTGDEPLLLARHSGCPVAIAPRRWQAVQLLLEQYDCNLIISDDGLQHYALQRDIEIAVLDDVRRYGNRRCLPAGPLRESVGRLQKIDFLVTKGAALEHEFPMQYHDNNHVRNVADSSETLHLDSLRGETVHAVAGIGHPAKFFQRLRDHGLKLHCHEFADHYAYKPQDLAFSDNLPILMTEKDAVKCQAFAEHRYWYLPIEARLPNSFGKRIVERLKGVNHGSKTT